MVGERGSAIVSFPFLYIGGPVFCNSVGLWTLLHQPWRLLWMKQLINCQLYFIGSYGADDLPLLQSVMEFNIAIVCGDVQGNNVVAVVPQQNPRNTFSTSSASEAVSHASPSLQQVRLKPFSLYFFVVFTLRNVWTGLSNSRHGYSQVNWTKYCSVLQQFQKTRCIQILESHGEYKQIE